MSKNTTPGVPGQDPTSTDNTNPAPKPEDMDLLEGVEALQNVLDANLPKVKRASFLRDIVVALRRAAWAAEKLIEVNREGEPAGEDEEPDTEPEPEHIPTLALTSDGRVLISITYLDGSDVPDRETWTGVILTEAEACDVLDRMSDAADDAAAHIGGSIIKRSKKNERGDE
ncbi:MAG: hypothetical protein HUU21_31185 [Polyangiaceae bacterium]|nr:hypothetical protein [Polyangiaceae bacterium]